MAILKPAWIHAAVAVLLAAGCKKAIEVKTTAYILGPQSQIVPVDKDVAAKIDPDILRASVLIATHMADKKVKFCSGNLIAPDVASEPMRILSNHHCFAVEDQDGKATPSLIPQACNGTTAYFGYLKGETAEATEIGCRAGSLRTNFDGDLSVFTLERNPPAKYKPLQIWDSDEVPENHQALIVHYPDVDEAMEVPPGGGAKLPTAEATLNNCKVIGTFNVSEWDLDRTLPFSLRHTCDLIHGSSGSGLIDVKTGKLLGVNWGGIKISFDSGTRTDNVATRSTFVMAFLNNTVDEQLKEADQRRNSADANVATSSQNSGEFKGTTQSVADSVRGRCGVAGGSSVRFLSLMWLLLALPFGAVAGKALAADSKPTVIQTAAPGAPSPAEAWAATYLLNAAMVAEVAAMPPDVMAAPGGEALRLRARFALASMQAKAQSSPDRVRVEALLSAQVAAKTSAASLDDVGSSFSEMQQSAWKNLAPLFAAKSPACALDLSDIRAFAAHQKALEAGGRGINAADLLQPLTGWDLPKVQCLVFALMASSPEAKAQEGFEPMTVLAALSDTGAKAASDPALLAITALRRLELGQYAESLRALMEITDREPSMRLAYELVQRVFSARQKGEGAVALQGM